MLNRAIAILAVVCLALGAGGCASKSNKDYEEVLMPLQTGSTDSTAGIRAQRAGDEIEEQKEGAGEAAQTKRRAQCNARPRGGKHASAGSVPVGKR